MLRPDKAQAPPPPTGYAQRATVERGAVLALIANGKPMARELLELIAEELRRELPIGDVEIHDEANELQAGQVEPQTVRRRRHDAAGCDRPSDPAIEGR